MTVLGGLQYRSNSGIGETYFVSIPMTVLGGLQFEITINVARSIHRFNTDDGIRRAAICATDRADIKDDKFQYR